ncbi:MAG: hypothetical protein Homavirus30_1, partial [Homavirus sp.]
LKKTFDDLKDAIHTKHMLMLDNGEYTIEI